MDSSIAKLIFLSGAKYRNPSLWHEYDRLKDSEWLSRAQLTELQIGRARAFLEFAERYSPYYKKVFTENKFSASKVDSIKSMKTIPTITKKQLIEHNEAIHTDYDFNKMFVAETSGTTGSALEFRKNERWDSINRASMMRGYDWYGVKPWDRYGYFWGYDTATLQAIKAKMLDIVQNRFRIFAYNKKSIETFAKKLSTATYVAGYSSMIYEVAKLINEIEVEKPKLKLVKGTSEMILDVYQLEAKKAFGRKIISEYGAAESGLIAFECPEGNMHINMEDVIVEVDEDNEIVVTNLASFSFPVIRYRLGDSVKLSNDMCSCGRAHPIIKEVIGRKGVSVIGIKTIYPALTFYYVFKNLAIQKSIFLNYKAAQEEKGVVDLCIEGKENICYESVLVEELIKYFEEDIRFHIRFVKDFDKKNRKSQYFESRI